MSQSFRYRGYLAEPSPADPGRIFFRPMVPFLVEGRTKAREVVGLVDTGAAVTILPMIFWSDGIIDPDFVNGEEEDLEAANGTVIRVRYATVNLVFDLRDVRHRWGAKVAFSDDRDEAVLGDVGFLRYFKALFDRRRQILSVDLSGQLPPAHLFR